MQNNILKEWLHKAFYTMRLKGVSGLLTLALILVCFVGCKDKTYGCSYHPDEYYVIHEDSNLKLQYAGSDSMKFRHYVDSVLTDTIVWVGQGKTYDKELIKWEPDYEGCGHHIYGDRVSIAFKSNKQEYDMKFRIVANTVTDIFYYTLFSYSFYGLVDDINDPVLGAYYKELILKTKSILMSM